MYQSKSIDDNVLLFSTEFLEQREYWTKQLTTDVSNTEISFDCKYESQRDKKKDLKTMTLVLGHDTSGQLLKLGKQVDLSIYIMLLAALKSFIYRYTGNTDITVISPLNKFKIKEDTINSFVFIRDQLDGEITFKELVLKIRETLLQAYNHQDYPMGKFVEFLFGTPPGENGTFISNIVCALNTLHSDRNINQLPGGLAFLFEREENRFTCRISYDPGAYNDFYIHQVSKHFTGILEHVLRDVHIKISRVSYLSPQEKRRLLLDFSGTEADYPREKTIPRLFAEQVEKTPDNIAVVGVGVAAPHKDAVDARPGPVEAVTYRELSEISRQLARRLKEKACGVGTIVAIITHPVVEMMTAIMAVLETGACYLPIDPINPKGRINYLLTDSETKLLLTTPPPGDFADFEKEVLNINDEILYGDREKSKETVRSGGEIPDGGAAPGDPVYIIYTSGTTGNPKGVLVNHGNLANYVAWFSGTAGITGADRTLLTSSFAFDLGYTCIYPALLTGAQLHIPCRETYMLAESLLNYIGTHGISYLKMTPSLFSIVVEDRNFSAETCRRLRLVVLGGEAIQVEDVEKAFHRCNFLRVMNHYGPTEATIGCIAQFIEIHQLETYKAKPTIGKPICNTKAYILDRHLNLLPIGVAGELCISGAGIASGYFKRDALTAEKFREWQPQPAQDEEPIFPHQYPTTIYRTGDLARWLPEGNIEFLGRIDCQVKVRGYRIELEEIQGKLLRHQAVKETVVLAKEDGKGNKYLCAYIVPHEEAGIKFTSAPTAAAEKNNETLIAELRAFLAGELPDYMVPAYFMPIEFIPLTPNGKLDGKSLPEPRILTGSEYIAPRSEVERQLVRIWSEVLKVKSEIIGINTNFFELGGNSLHATILAARIHEKMNVRLPLTEVFQTPKISGLAGYINRSVKDAFISIKPAEKKELSRMSSSQRRLYILSQMEADSASTSYNIPLVFVLQGILHRDRLEQSFEKLIKRHESFRASFEMIDGEMVRIIHENVDFAMEYYECGEEKAREIVKNFERPFDLTRPPLLRAGLIKILEHKHILMMDTHHIISDGYSLSIVGREIAMLYAKEEPGPLKLRYTDYSEWQISEPGREVLKQQEKFWIKELAGTLPVMEILTDFPRSEQQDFSGAEIDFEIDGKWIAPLEKLSLKQGTTIHTVMLAIFNILLSRLTGQESIITGITVPGRSNADLENIVGLFTNTLALRTFPRGEKNFLEFLAEVKQRSVKAYENQDYPFEYLVEKLKPPRLPGRNPIFDMVFEIKNDFPIPDAEDLHEKSRLKFQPYDYERGTAVFDMIWTGTLQGGRIYFSVCYKTSLFKRVSIELMIDDYLALVKQIVKDVHVKIKDLGPGIPMDNQSGMDMNLEINFKF